MCNDDNNKTTAAAADDYLIPKGGFKASVAVVYNYYIYLFISSDPFSNISLGLLVFLPVS
jgi:hypothetical protein